MGEPLRPRVGVGVPTYNRPEGLRRTLACLCAQTYRELDILVSDNASPDPTVAAVVADMAARDPRIRYVRQPESLGAAGNFRFVLAQSDAEYFMWAADDDEWQPGFVEACMGALLSTPGAVSAMTGIETLYRTSGRRVPVAMPSLSVLQDAATNLRAFFARMTPGMFYGVHRREAIVFFLDDDMFDYYDCYFVLRLIAAGGVVLVDGALYTAGVDAAEYQVKPMRRSWGSGLRYGPFLRAVHTVIAAVEARFFPRRVLECSLALLVARLFVAQECAALVHRIRRFRG